MSEIMQRDLTLNLFFRQKLGGYSRTSTINYWHRPSAVDDKSEDSSLLNVYSAVADWMSECFVQSSRGDVVACAVDIDKPSPVLYISSNSVEEKSNDKDIAASFCKIVERIAQAYKSSKTISDEELEKLIGEVIKPICMYSWERVLNKLSKTKRSFPPNTSRDTMKDNFENLLEHWCGKTTDEEKPKPTELLLNEARLLYEVETPTEKQVTDTVIFHFRQLLHADFQDKDVEDPSKMQEDALGDSRCKILFKTIKHCSVIVGSPVMQALSTSFKQERDKFDFDQLRFLGKIYRQMWRVLKIKDGAIDFILTGMKSLWNMWKHKSTQPSLKLKAVFIYSTLTVAEKRALMISPIDMSAEEIRDWIAKRKQDAIGTRGVNTEELDRRIEKILNEIGKGHFKKTPRCHCEVSLIIYLVKNNIKVAYDVIGVSKYNCWSCAQFLSAFNADGSAPIQNKRKWIMSGSSGKFHCAWGLPSLTMFPRMNNALGSQISRARLYVANAAKRELDDYMRNLCPPDNEPQGPSGVHSKGYAPSVWGKPTNPGSTLSYSSIAKNVTVKPQEKPSPSSKPAPKIQGKGHDAQEKSSHGGKSGASSGSKPPGNGDEVDDPSDGSDSDVGDKRWRLEGEREGYDV